MKSNIIECRLFFIQFMKWTNDCHEITTSKGNVTARVSKKLYVQQLFYQLTPIQCWIC